LCALLLAALLASASFSAEASRRLQDIDIESLDSPKFDSSNMFSDLNLELQAIVFTDIEGNRQNVYNELTIKLAEQNAITKVKNLRTNIAAIISNVVVGKGNNIDNIIELLALNESVAATVTANIEAFAVNEIDGSKNKLINDLNLEVLNDADFLHNVFLQLTGLTFTDIKEGRGNEAQNNLNLEFGTDAKWGRDGGDFTEATEAEAYVSTVLDAILVNEIANGNDNIMKNVLDIAVFNNMELDGIRSNIEVILVNQLENANKNDLENIVNIALGVCSSGECSARDFALDVSAIVLNDIIGDGSIIENLIDVSGLSADVLSGTDALEQSIFDIEAIIVNTIRPGGLADADPEAFENSVYNEMNLKFFQGATLGEIQTLIDGIIANEIDGARNNVENVMNLQIGNKDRRRR